LYLVAETVDENRKEIKEMAEEEEKNPEEESQEIPKKGLPVKKIIIAVMLLFILGGGFLAWHSGVFAGLLGKKAKPGTTTEGGAGQKGNIGPVYAMDTFIVNLIGQGKSYLKAKVELELDGEPALEEIGRRLPQLRDAILLILSSKSFMDINTLEGKYQLRAEIMAILNQHLKTGRITNIYFTDFIIQ